MGNGAIVIWSLKQRGRQEILFIDADIEMVQIEWSGQNNAASVTTFALSVCASVCSLHGWSQPMLTMQMSLHQSGPADKLPKNIISLW